MLHRLNGHIQKAKYNNGRKDIVINELAAVGLKPLIEDLEICYGYLEPMHAEKWWIYHYACILNTKLTNCCALSSYYTIRKNVTKFLKRDNRVWW